jgi:16S rRNA (guanine527-N7)-methyltransferase
MAAAGDSGVGCRVTAKEIEESVAAAGLSALTPEAGTRLAQYVEILLRWNSRMNLTAVREPAEVVSRHLLECVQCAQVLPQVDTLLDFGSGGGLPGIPIAIVRPEIRVTLGESQGKKAAFLREAVRSLGLNAEVYDRRIETMSGDRVFDAVTLRAVDKMEEAGRAAIRRLGTGGWLVVFATTGTETSIRAGLPDIDWNLRSPATGSLERLLILGLIKD